MAWCPAAGPSASARDSVTSSSQATGPCRVWKRVVWVVPRRVSWERTATSRRDANQSRHCRSDWQYRRQLQSGKRRGWSLPCDSAVPACRPTAPSRQSNTPGKETTPAVLIPTPAALNWVNKWTDEWELRVRMPLIRSMQLRSEILSLSIVPWAALPSAIKLPNANSAAATWSTSSHGLSRCLLNKPWVYCFGESPRVIGTICLSLVLTLQFESLPSCRP